MLAELDLTLTSMAYHQMTPSVYNQTLRHLRVIKTRLKVLKEVKMPFISFKAFFASWRKMGQVVRPPRRAAM